MFSKLLFINGIFTALGGILLIFIPNSLMKLFGIQLPQSDFFICYLLGVASLSFSVLSFLSMTLKDKASLKVIALTFLIFNAAEAFVGLYEFTTGFSSFVLGNVTIHVVFSVLFWYFGFYRIVS
jgi:hypothetical protein